MQSDTFTLPSEEVRDHKIVFVKKEMNPIWITEYQAIAIRNHQWLWVTIRENPMDDKSAVLYDGKKSNIEQIIPMDWKKIREYQGLRYFNDFWESRLIVDINNDDAPKRYKCSGYLFSMYMSLKFKYVYPQDISQNDRKIFLRWSENKTYSEVTSRLLEEIKKLQVA